jgi:uncharacterized membrane protein
LNASIYLLIGLVCFLAAAWLLRGLIFGNLGFCTFMVWNLILGTTPVLIIPLITFVASNTNGVLEIVLLSTLSLIWLLFLPNSYYLLTDLMHLNPDVVITKRDKGYSISVHHERGDALFILDGLLLMLSASVGALIGGSALLTLYRFLEINYLDLRYIVISIILLLSALGIYIGRYNRWNSWDAITKPRAVINDTLRSMTNKLQRRNLAITIVTMLLFQLLSLIVVANY